MLRRLAALVALTAAACSGTTSTTLERPTVAFVLVGAADDLGYNQAVFEGTLEVARRFPDVRILRREGVPEDATAELVIRELVEEEGADLVFATSFGHLEHAWTVAEDHPEVVFVHQGGVEPSPGRDNFGTYFGSHWEAMYVAGIAAGHATSTGRLGFVGAFPIPATVANVNAFTLGAREVVPEATTRVVLTGAWCDPAAQADAVATLLDDGVDVLAQHQDCTATILRAGEDAGIAGVVGYHSDGSEVAPSTWLVGAVWTWGDVYARIVATTLDGSFASSPWNGDWRGSIAEGDNPFALTGPGPVVSAPAAAAMATAERRLADGFTPFRGPLVDAEGTMRLADGEVLTVEQVDAIDWFVRGVEVAG